MPIITFRGGFVAVGGGLWKVFFTCNDNHTIGRCKVRLVNAEFFASSLGSYQGMYRFDSVDGQLSNPRACSSYGGFLLNPFDAGQYFMRDSLQWDKSYEWECNLSTSNLTLQMLPATLLPQTPSWFTDINFDSGTMTFEVTPL